MNVEGAKGLLYRGGLVIFMRLFLFALIAGSLAGCASSRFKARQEQREKIANSAGLYCDFISGDLYPDLEVELNMQMARRCDVNRNFSITNYKNASAQNGIMYCCALSHSYAAHRAFKENSSKDAAKEAPKKEAPVEEEIPE